MNLDDILEISIPIVLLFLECQIKWNCYCTRLCLASFTVHNTFKIHSYHINIAFLSLPFHCMDVNIIRFIHLLVDKPFVLFPTWAYYFFNVIEDLVYNIVLISSCTTKCLSHAHAHAPSYFFLLCLSQDMERGSLRCVMRLAYLSYIIDYISVNP